MKAPLSFIKEFVEIDEDINIFSDKMIMSGSNIEEVKDYSKEIENVIIGEVVEVKPHTDSDHLVVVQVKVSDDKILQIVTGADNVHVGALVPVALSPSKLPGGVKIKDTVMRGVKSNGMICSSEELGFSNSVTTPSEKHGIWEIENYKEYENYSNLGYPKINIGENILSENLLDEKVVDFEITPNRSDCLSIYGIANEVKATFDKKLKKSDKDFIFDDSKLSNSKYKIAVESENLIRYTIREITDVNIKPAPFFIRRALMLAGVRPINNIVDITNYVMLELGNPIHAFDSSMLDGEEIIIRDSKEGETFVTLDENKRELKKGTMLICDSKKPIAIAGVMGGLNSGITNETKSVIIESACFDSDSIRLTSKNLGLRTEASGRYEKGVSPKFSKLAQDRVSELIEKTGAGKVKTKIVDVYSKKQEEIKITLSTLRTNKLLGIDLNSDEIIEILKRLDIEKIGEGEAGDEFVFLIPFYRLDLKEEIDLIEEVGRIYGYDNIPTTLPKTVANIKKLELLELEKKIKNSLKALSFNEISTYSFASDEDLEFINTENKDEVIKILNPLGEETANMRTSLIPNILNIVSLNLSRNNNRLNLFEVGNTFKFNTGVSSDKNERENINPSEKTKDLKLESNKEKKSNKKSADELDNYKEEKSLVIASTGENLDFYYLKSVVNEIFNSIGITDLIYEAEQNNDTYHKGKCANILISKEYLKNRAIKYKEFELVKANKFSDIKIGTIGELSPITQGKFKITKKVMLAEFFVDDLVNYTDLKPEYKSIPKFPAIVRDISIVVKKDILFSDILRTINEGQNKFLVKTELVDIYEGENIDEDKKSVSFRNTYRVADRTLKDEEINKVEQNIIKNLSEKIGAKLRDF